MSRCCCTLLLVALAAACGERAPSSSAAPADSVAADSTPREAQPDTAFNEYEHAVWLDIESDATLSDADARALVARLQPIADGAADEPTAAPALLRLAWLKLRLHDGGVPERVVAQRPQDFAYFEIQGDYFYNGADLDSLRTRFPASPLQDDAAYAATYRPRGGECEGHIGCYLAAGIGRLMEFMAAHPTSRHVPAAVARANAHINDMLEDVPDLRVAGERYDPAEVRALLARYDSVTQLLPHEARAEAIAALEPVLERFSERAEPLEEPAEPYPLVRQVGLFYGDGTAACVMMEDPRINIGTPVLLVSVSGRDTVSGRISTPLRRRCAGPTIFPPPRLAAFAVALSRPIGELADGIALVAYEPDVRFAGGRVTARMGDGEQVLAECTVTEGRHHDIRDAASGKQLWHAYVGFGFQVEPTCRDG